ncbi:GumC family protein [Thermodesulfovibrio yellowstonii]|uniref:LPS biosynthesis protein n=1 Tax=Thermodesulfovibrio yellowstonii TaxID=28262 RepID=A0A9W6LK29_9BACT|nr:Wzz/FepE/Etk N-terminal domain-containing protein [Thermodesulfovibrio islandicus]GLI52400.1 LPS biosynthesis protein [Thermodesulfovibrio islandicus]
MEEKQTVQDDEINLLDLLVVLLKHKSLIIGITLGAVIITVIISLIMSPVYRAETKILLKTQDQDSAITQLFGGGAEFIMGERIRTQNEVYIGLLESRSVLDNIIERFNLMELYKTKDREDARKTLAQSLKAQVDKKTGIINIGFEDKDPKRAADIANAFVEELNNMNKTLALTEASQRRLLLEEQLKNAKESLIKVEESMTRFQEATGVIKMEDQAKALLESIASLRAQIAAKEVQLKVMSTYATPQNPDRQRLEEELKGMREQLRRLEGKSGHTSDPLLPAGRIPSVGTEYIRKMREFKLNEALYEILLKQYEAAKLKEVKSVPVILTVEKAIPPEKRIKPKRMLMVIIAGFSGLFFSIFLAFFMEYKEKLSNDPENKQRLETLKKYANFKLKN